MGRKLANKERIVQLYNNGYGTQKIAVIEQVHRSTVQYALIKSNVKLRKRSPISHHNVHFFEKYNIENCYWAGFIISDGHVRKKGNAVDLHLAKKDLSHLEKFANAISFDGNIEYCKDSSVRLTISGKWVVDDLKKNFLIGSQKTLTCKFPEKIPNKFYSHFVRGLFDGDGCVSYSTVPYINFTSNFFILLFLREYFFSSLKVHIKRKGKKPKIVDKGACGQLCYSGMNANKVLHWMYFNSNKDTRLDRKYNRYLNLFYEKYLRKN